MLQQIVDQLYVVDIKWSMVLLWHIFYSLAFSIKCTATHIGENENVIESKQIMIHNQDNLVLVSIMSRKGGKIKRERKSDTPPPPHHPTTWVFSIRFEMLGNMVPNLKCKQVTIVAL